MRVKAIGTKMNPGAIPLFLTALDKKDARLVKFIRENLLFAPYSEKEVEA